MRKKGKGRGEGKRNLMIQHSRVDGGFLVPSETTVSLKYVLSQSLSAIGAQYATKRWTPNSAYDIDPILGSSAMAGYAEWAAFYSYYRVVAYKYSIAVTNAEAFPVAVYMLNTNVDPGVAGTNGQVQASNPLSQQALLGPLTGGANRKVFNRRLRVSQVVGTMAPETADSFRAVTTAAPADLIWLAVVADTMDSTHVFSAHLGVFIQVTIEPLVRFYGRKTLLN